MFVALFNERRGWRIAWQYDDGHIDICGAADEITAHETAALINLRSEAA